MAPPGELALIQALRTRTAAARDPVRLGIGDDCAVLRPPRGHDILVTTDFSLEGRHFRREWHPAVSVGHRCLARGLSDLAAMGAKPLAAFLSLALPGGFTRRATGRRWVDDFFAGLLALAEQTGTSLAGGDTATAPGEAILADIVLLGSAPRGSELRRSGARTGDLLYVTGSLGGAAAELELLSEKPARFRRAVNGLDHPHLFPAPRLLVGERLRRAGLATAAIDLSDGLSTDLRHLCAESGTGAIVDADSIPLHPLLAGKRPEIAMDLALNGGEDYELLFTVPEGVPVPRRVRGVPVTRIGKITRSTEILLRSSGGSRPMAAGGWEHSL
ncbi:MAG: thiamine-phosphate kinase [Janthinobacterium lividum]